MGMREMKQTNPLKKYFFNKGSMVLLGIIVLLSFTLYSYSLYEYSQIDVHASLSEKNQKSVSEYNSWKRVSECSLVVFSVSASSIISTFLIEKRNSNKIIEEFFVSDFFTSDKFLDLIEPEQRYETLKLLEKKVYFNECEERSAMYTAIKNKILNPVFEHDLIYNSYDIDVSCNVKENYIEKRIVRNTSVRSAKKHENISNYVLLSVCSCDIEGRNPVTITRLTIDGETINVNLLEKKETDYNNALDHKKGYIKKIDFIYKRSLHFSNKKSVNITMEYETCCPIYDKAYSCRMPYPCKKFDFKYDITNEDYRLIPYAFGFIDDANNTPNRTDNKRRVSIRFEDWIFPLDGVCVYIEKAS